MERFENKDKLLIEPAIAESEHDVARLKDEGQDPIIFRADEHVSYVYTKRDDVVHAILEGNN